MIRGKKALAFFAGALMTAALAFSPMSVKSADTGKVSMPSSISTEGGKTISVQVKYSNNGIKGVTGTFTYDEEVLKFVSFDSDLPNFTPNSKGRARFTSASITEYTGTVTAKFEVLTCKKGSIELSLDSEISDGVSDYNKTNSTTVSISHPAGQCTTEEKAPTCTADGYKKVTCGLCGTVDTEVLDALGHDGGQWVITKDATCGEDGKKELRCTRDQFVLDTETIPATGKHSYKSKITKPATCVDTGTEVQTCDVCGDTRTVVIPATGKHTYKSEITKPATCGAAGTEVQTCDVCGDTKTVVIPATGKHTYKSEITKPATCGAAGTEVQTCDVCGETKTVVIPATGKHTYKSEITKPATCGEAGTEVQTCDVCGDTKTVVIPATGEHTYEWKITAEATCTKAGEREGICKVCQNKVTEAIPALGHTWKTDDTTDKDGWKVVTEATHEKEGLKERVCSVCGEKETAVIAKLTAENTEPTENGGKDTGKTDDKNAVKTGDQSSFLLYLSVGAAAACGIGGIIVVQRRRKHS